MNENHYNVTKGRWAMIQGLLEDLTDGITLKMPTDKGVLSITMPNKTALSMADEVIYTLREDPGPPAGLIAEVLGRQDGERDVEED